MHTRGVNANPRRRWVSCSIIILISPLIEMEVPRASMTPWEAAAQYGGRVDEALGYIDEYRAAASHVTLDDFVDDEDTQDFTLTPAADTFNQPTHHQQTMHVSEVMSVLRWVATLDPWKTWTTSECLQATWQISGKFRGISRESCKESCSLLSDDRFLWR